jgi:hypothetical protein
MGVKLNVPYLKAKAVASPAAGAEFTITAPGEGLWRIISLAFTVTTDATVSNRSVGLFVDDGTSVVWRSVAAAVQTATLAWDYCAFAGAGNSDNTGSSNYFPLPDGGLLLPAGWRLRSSTNNLQAADAYSAIAAFVEEYPNGPATEWQPTLARAEYERS